MNTQHEKDADELRIIGMQSFRSMVRSFPFPFQLKGDVRKALEVLPSLKAAPQPELPAAAPWRFGRCFEEDANTVELEYYAEPKWVDFYLGFLEALVDYCNQTAFILVKAMRNQLQFRLVLA